MQELTIRERTLLIICAERYVADLRQACAEDQGNPDGEPGTLGNDLQVELQEVRRKLRTY